MQQKSTCDNSHISSSNYPLRFSCQSDNTSFLNMSISTDNDLEMRWSEAIDITPSDISGSQRQSISFQRQSNGCFEVRVIEQEQQNIFSQVTQQNVSKKQSAVQLQPQSQISQLSSSTVAQNHMPLNVLAILTSQRQMVDLRIFYKEDPSRQKSIFMKTSYAFQSTNIIIFFIKTNLQQMLDLKIEYHQKSPKMLLFSSKMKKQIQFYGIMINQEAALLFPQLTQKNTNLILQNYCILIANEHLTKNLRFFQDLKCLSQFYKIFKDCFKHKQQFNKQLFQYYQPTQMTKDSTQFFIYFFYSIYGSNNPIQQMKEFQIFKRIQIPKKLQSIFKYRYYNIFEKSYKLFLLSVFFQVAAVYRKIDDQLLKDLAIWNILYQDEQIVKQTIIKVECYRSCLFDIFNHNEANQKIISSSKISLHSYALYKIRYTQKKISRSKPQELDEILFKFIDNLVAKQRSYKSNLQKNQLESLQYQILGLFVAHEKLIQQIQAEQLYNKLKFSLNHALITADFLINLLKKYIFKQLPALLVSNYENTIIPLIMKPVIPEENNILLNHFQHQNIEIEQLLLLMRILQQKSQDDYNVNTIEFVIIQFVQFNPHFNQDYLQKIIIFFTEQLKNITTTERYKKNFPTFCEKIIHSIKHQSMRNCLTEWLVASKTNNQNAN